MKKVTLLNQSFNVHDRLEQFNVNIAQSSSVSFFGSNPNTGSMFVQFKNGGTYIYSGVTPEVRKEMHTAPSIGSFISKNLVKKFPSEKLEGKGIFS
ncbi:KTSC domain-containing protein [Pedobacter agri]|uniref:KTSC domain-containing protein n=1 Tax=Pedobacter agri TaxID=454586 RepID=A0A9X3DGA9_9SPHI|nr:KTSC domain-containing protein [Pedobacter agri]MCX3266581.1 KTSC domain-containing protein [Pedobacter agri]